MTDKIRSFKEEIDHIHVPVDKLDAIILNTVQGRLPKRNSSIRKKILYSVGAAVVVFGLFLSSATNSPVMANIVSQIPIIGTIFSESEDRGLEQVSKQGLADLVGITKTVEGTSITLHEVFYDKTRFTIGFSIESEKPLGEFYLSSGPSFTVNGKSFSHAGDYKETEISKTHRTGIANIEAFEELPEAFTLGLKFNGKDGKQWDFSTPVSAQANVQSVAIHHTQKAGGIDLTVTDLQVSPAGLLFTLSAQSEKPGYLSGVLDFKVIDEKGNELVSHSGGSKVETMAGKEHLTGTRLIDPIGDNVKKLTITPYLTQPIGGSSVKIDAQGNDTITEFNPLKGADIEFKSFTVTLP
ncbi:DUF4179 domain-containing protein [Peribacillus huizhouensis]|uniref:DUF4179 domain-containing protein n=1 Tax=Peribacillus huizhouensis TaxID=1501239 RepID=A0ABR6CKV0_9BACI|nr:DUF4179 domain-containing protein [Peribacillus huizhouensis]MBA9025556.1 hypothetical protein [Peribacillus huizhouensis]